MESAGKRCTEGSTCSFYSSAYKRNLKNLLLSITLAVLVTGCATSPDPTYTVEVTPPKRPVLQQNLVSECPDLPKLDKTCYNQGEVVDILTEWIALYKKCQYKHAETVRFVQDYLRE